VRICIRPRSRRSWIWLLVANVGLWRDEMEWTSNANAIPQVGARLYISHPTSLRSCRTLSLYGCISSLETVTKLAIRHQYTVLPSRPLLHERRPGSAITVDSIRLCVVYVQTYRDPSLSPNCLADGIVVEEVIGMPFMTFCGRDLWW